MTLLLRLTEVIVLVPVDTLDGSRGEWIEVLEAAVFPPTDGPGIHTSHAILVEDVEDLWLEKDLEILADEERDIESEVGAVNVIFAVGVAGLPLVAPPERRGEIAWVLEPPIVTATHEDLAVGAIGRAGPVVFEPTRAHVEPGGGDEVPHQPCAQLVALVDREVAISI